MSIFDSFGSVLPTVTSAVNQTVTGTVNYSIADTGTLLDEGFSAVKSKYGTTAPFVGLNTGGPTFSDLNAAASFKTIEQSDPYYHTAVSVANVQTSSVSAAQVNAAVGHTANADDTEHKVKLVASVMDGPSNTILDTVSFPSDPLIQRVVEFDIMPEVSEQRSVDYEALSPPQAPGEFQKFKGTKSVQWQIVGTFVCRTRDEAKRNYIFLNTLRGWSQSYFGDNQRLQFQNKLGAPPPVLTFTGWRGLVGSVPVVMTSTQWNFPKDCDWIPTGIRQQSGAGLEIPFPTVMTVTVTLVESFSPAQFNAFDLVAFRNGDMIGAFGGQAATTENMSVARSELAGPGSGLAPGLFGVHDGSGLTQTANAGLSPGLFGVHDGVGVADTGLTPGLFGVHDGTALAEAVQNKSFATHDTPFDVNSKITNAATTALNNAKSTISDFIL
jgi:hypothetical protein